MLQDMRRRRKRQRTYREVVADLAYDRPCMLVDLRQRMLPLYSTPGEEPAYMSPLDVRLVGDRMRNELVASGRSLSSPTCPAWKRMDRDGLGDPQDDAANGGVRTGPVIERHEDSQVNAVPWPEEFEADLKRRLEVVSALDGGKEKVRERARKPRDGQHIVCLSYVQTDENEVPEEVAQDWARGKGRLDAAGVDVRVWLDKLPLGDEKGWWVKGAPLVYSVMPVYVSPPTLNGAAAYGTKLSRSVPDERRMYVDLLQSIHTHLNECSSCREEYSTLIEGVCVVIRDIAKSVRRPNVWAADLRSVDPTQITPLLLQNMVHPGWKYRLWPRMEVSAANLARGALVSEETAFAAAQLSLLSSMISAWAASDYGGTDRLSDVSALGSVKEIWTKVVWRWRKCRTPARLDKGIWMSVVQAYVGIDYTWETRNCQRMLVIGNSAQANMAILAAQILSENESIDQGMFWRGANVAFGAREKDISHSFGALAATVHEVGKIPVAPGAIYDVADVMSWKVGVESAFSAGRGTELLDQFQLDLVDETSRNILPIERTEHGAIGQYSGPGMELPWIRYCRQRGTDPGAEADRLNKEMLRQSNSVMTLYKVLLPPSDAIRALNLSERAVCHTCSSLSYKRCGIATWREVPASQEGARVIWGMEEMDSEYHLQLCYIQWCGPQAAPGGAEDPFHLLLRPNECSSEWLAERGDSCAECQAPLGWWSIRKEHFVGASMYFATVSGEEPSVEELVEKYTVL